MTTRKDLGAKPYDNNKTYTAGDLVTESGTLYIANQVVPVESFDSAKWDEVGSGDSMIVERQTAEVGNICYKGSSSTFGALTSDPVWFIERWDLSDTDNIITTQVSGSQDQIWDDHLTLTYS